MEISKVLVNGQSYNLKDTYARELIDQTNKKVEYNRNKNIPLYTIIGKAIPLRPVVGYLYYTNKVKVTGKDIKYFGTIKASDFSGITKDNFINANEPNIAYDKLVKGEVKDESVSYVINISNESEKHFYRIKPYTGHITINDLEIIERSQLPLASKNFTLFYNNQLINGYDYNIVPTIVAKNYIINHNALLHILRNIIENLYRKPNNYRYKVYYTRKRVVKYNFFGASSYRNRAGQQWCLARFNSNNYDINNISNGCCGYSYIYIIKLIEF